YIKFEGKLFEGKHEPIIDKEIWDKAQTIFSLRSYIPEKVHHGSYFLTGFLKCPQCGASMVQHVSSCGKYRYYKCLNNKNGKSCKAKSVRQLATEEYILSKINSIVTSPQIRQILINKMEQSLADDMKASNNKIKRLKKDLSKISKKV